MDLKYFLKSNDHFSLRIKIFLIIVVIFVTAPTATHAITKAAYLDGLQPWTGDEDVNGVDGIKSDTQDERAEQEKAGDQQ